MTSMNFACRSSTKEGRHAGSLSLGLIPNRQVNTITLKGFGRLPNTRSHYMKILRKIYKSGADKWIPWKSTCLERFSMGQCYSVPVRTRVACVL